MLPPAICILWKFNEHPNDTHFQAAKNVMKYSHATSGRILI
jgi:hypothetical protein